MGLSLALFPRSSEMKPSHDVEHLEESIMTLKVLTVMFTLVETL